MSVMNCSKQFSDEISLATLPPDIIRYIIPISGEPFSMRTVSLTVIFIFYKIISKDIIILECAGARFS